MPQTVGPGDELRIAGIQFLGPGGDVRRLGRIPLGMIRQRQILISGAPPRIFLETVFKRVRGFVPLLRLVIAHARLE